jgi:D-alanyl-D-alanine carboxypeptidase/D-alanyl-D-alanine-endopeptidase (penicillin-binding protein 4)
VSPVRRLLRALVLCLVTLVPAGPSLAAQTLPVGIPNILKASGLAVSGTGVTIVDLTTGKVAFRYHAWRKLAPASNEKLFTTVAALETLRPGFRFETTLSGAGTRAGATYHGDIFLVGSGDPTLRSGGLKTLAKRLRQSGIRHVQGRILGDESIFDRVRFGPQWKTSFYGIESPPLSGLSVNRNLAASGLMLPYPALSAARLMRKALIAQGITVSGKAATGKAPFGAGELSSVSSKQLWMILRSMDRYSDNFVAEMVLKAVGALGGGKGTTAGGVAVAESILAEMIGEDAKNLHLVDGSGLSSANRATSSAFAELLARTATDRTLGPPLLQALAIAGVNGTLRDRPAGAGRVLAKTGTLDGVSSLSGYATTKSGQRFAFSILMNGRYLSDWKAHEAQDKIAALVAAQP